MPRIRRFAAALSSILLLQLSLLGSGTPCAVHGTMEAGGAHLMAGMAAADRGTASASQSAEASALPDDPAASAGGGDSEDGGGCPLPWAPGQCTSMTSCTATATPVATVFALDAAPRVVSELAEPAGMLSRPTTAPESPPPRS